MGSMLETEVRKTSRRGFLADLMALGTATALNTFPFFSVGQSEARVRERQSLGFPQDLQHLLPKGRTRRRRATRYILLHNTQGEFLGDLNTIKRHAKANYLVNRDGRVYSIVDVHHWANHAGKSMWEGQENLGDISIGIEIVGYNYVPITDTQYTSLKPLVKYLQKQFNIPDKNVLAHYQVSYGQNHWTRGKKARGRKKDGININWERLGINHRTDDPDVKAGRVVPDSYLAAILQNEERNRKQDPLARVRVAYGPSELNVIANGKTAWSIAGDEYDQQTTFYIFPNKQVMVGNKITDWDKIPVGTKVYTNTSLEAVMRTLQPIIVLEQGETAWSKVQGAYSSGDTIYIYPDGKTIVTGNRADFTSIPPKTRIILGSKGPYNISKYNTPHRIAPNAYKTEQAVYVYPDGNMKSGSEIKDFRSLPRGTRMLVRKS